MWFWRAQAPRRAGQVFVRTRRAAPRRAQAPGQADPVYGRGGSGKGRPSGCARARRRAARRLQEGQVRFLRAHAEQRGAARRPLNGQIRLLRAPAAPRRAVHNLRNRHIRFMRASGVEGGLGCYGTFEALGSCTRGFGRSIWLFGCRLSRRLGLAFLRLGANPFRDGGRRFVHGRIAVCGGARRAVSGPCLALHVWTHPNWPQYLITNVGKGG